MFRRQRSVTVLGGLTACLSTLSARRVEDLRTPCLICCRATLEKNAATMRERAAALDLQSLSAWLEMELGKMLERTAL